MHFMTDGESSSRFRMHWWALALIYAASGAIVGLFLGWILPDWTPLEGAAIFVSVGFGVGVGDWWRRREPHVGA